MCQPALRPAAAVVGELLEALDSTVTAYHPSVQRTGRTLAELVQGTSFFPGGSGLWRGQAPGGPLPALFPERPVMFVGHNFGNAQMLRRALRNRGEANCQFWRALLGMLRVAGLDPAECFFTNALMGLRPGGATGPMPRVPAYTEQCGRYLVRQAEIVRARCVVALGKEAACFVGAVPLPSIDLKHPSGLVYCKGPLRPGILHEEGRKIAALLANLPF